MRPGLFLQLTALGGAAGTLVAVVSGTAGLGTGHEVLAALALPPLAAVVVLAWTSYRQLLAPSLAALVLFGLAVCWLRQAGRSMRGGLLFRRCLNQLTQSPRRGRGRLRFS